MIYYNKNGTPVETRQALKICDRRDLLSGEVYATMVEVDAGILWLDSDNTVCDPDAMEEEWFEAWSGANC